jgi:hypothetical protein
MKPYLLFLIVLIASPSFAQTLNGTVFDMVSKKPISNVQIITSLSTNLTNTRGEFKLTNIKARDRFAVRMMGYETVEFTVNNTIDSLRIFLKQSILQLDEVMVKTKRNYINDSLSLRKEYANVFAYKPPKFIDMFIKIDPNYRSPFPNANPNSTASIIKLDVLSVLSFVSKKKNSTSKLKATLLQTEETNYVDNLFSKDKVKDITKLQGDSLTTFMNSYRPSSLKLKKMTEYELLQYIKLSHLEFKKLNSIK